MKALGPYDGTLGMFIEPPREPDRPTLDFYRYLIATGRLESPIRVADPQRCRCPYCLVRDRVLAGR